jgi:predicted DsbA family dithiol-disulfide isomerase
LQKEYDIAVRWIAFPLHPETPEEGLALEELFAHRGLDINAMQNHLRQMAAEIGLSIGERKMTFNSRLAQELAKWGEFEGKGDELHRALFKAYFADGKNIGKKEILVELAAGVNLSAGEANFVLRERRFREAVDHDWGRARELGIRAVPTFVMAGECLVGAQPYHALASFVERHGARPIVGKFKTP